MCPSVFDGKCICVNGFLKRVVVGEKMAEVLAI
jgi:hypothetical protein